MINVPTILLCEKHSLCTENELNDYLIVSGWRNYDVLSLATAAAAGTASTACFGIRFPYSHWNKGKPIMHSTIILNYFITQVNLISNFIWTVIW